MTGGEGFVGPNDAHLGPGTFYFLFLYIFINFSLSTATVHFTMTQRPHPRSKCESVGSFFYYACTDPHPRSKCKSVGLFLICYTNNGPTLAANTSWWAVLTPRPRVGGPFYAITPLRTPPSLQTRVGGVLSFFI